MFLSLRWRGLEVSYHRTRTAKEVDFVYQGGNGKTGIIQVCWSMGDERTRIVTADRAEELVVAGKRVEVVPAWRYLLDAGA